MAGWIKMLFGTEVGLSPGHTMLDRDPGPPTSKKGHSSPQFLAHVYFCQTTGWIKMELGMEVGLGPVHIVLDRDLAPPPPKGHSPQFFGSCLLRPNGWMDQDAT